MSGTVNRSANTASAAEALRARLRLSFHRRSRKIVFLLIDVVSFVHDGVGNASRCAFQMNSDYEAFLRRLSARDVASSSDLVGCSDAEIVHLEARYSITLPVSYRWYLSAMGKKSGRLFTHDHMAVYFDHVCEMTAQHRQDAIEYPDEPTVELPDDALIVAGRLGEQFQFLRCNDPDDSAVWYFNEYDHQIVDSAQSVLDWLESFCDAAEQAIQNGYFDIYPNGTTP